MIADTVVMALAKGDVITLISIGVPALIALYVGVRSSNATATGGAAAQYQALSDRMAEVETRLGESERSVGALVLYIYTLWGLLGKAGITIPPPPESVAIAFPGTAEAKEEAERNRDS